MPGPNWTAAGRRAVRLFWHQLMRSLLMLGSMATGVLSPGWWRERGEHWWEGARPTEESGPRSVIAAARAEPGALDDPEVLRRMRSLRGSQDLPRPGETARRYADAAPYWHPERRRAGGGS